MHVIRCKNLYPFLQAMRRLLTRRESIHGQTKQQSCCVRTQKKMHTRWWKYTIISHAMSLRLVGGGLARVAGQSCLAGPSVLRLHPDFGHRRTWKYGREPCPESQAFLCGAAHFWSTTGRALCGSLSPTSIFPGVLLPHRP